MIELDQLKITLGFEEGLYLTLVRFIGVLFVK